jgi:hypothetical protein
VTWEALVKAQGFAGQQELGAEQQTDGQARRQGLAVDHPPFPAPQHHGQRGEARQARAQPHLQQRAHRIGDQLDSHLLRSPDRAEHDHDGNGGGVNGLAISHKRSIPAGLTRDFAGPLIENGQAGQHSRPPLRTRGCACLGK